MRIDVKDVAELAKLKLTDKELEEMRKDLEFVLGRVKSGLSNIDVEGIPPTFGCSDIERVELDEDIPRPGLPREVFLQGVPLVDSVYVRVPRESGENKSGEGGKV